MLENHSSRLLGQWSWDFKFLSNWNDEGSQPCAGMLKTLQRVEFNDSDLHFQKTRVFFFRTKSLSLKFLLPYDTF